MTNGKQESLAVETKIYIGIRRCQDSGKEWADTSNASLDYATCVKLTLQANASIPDWARANPIMRFSEFDLLENHTVGEV